MRESGKTSRWACGTRPQVIDAARELRKQMTLAEQTLWAALRAGRLHGLKFRRQHPVGPFILDFWCPSHRLVVEIDGGVHDNPRQARADRARTDHLGEFGYRVLRFRNDEVLTDLSRVLERIVAGTNPHPPDPLPPTLGEGGDGSSSDSASGERGDDFPGHSSLGKDGGISSDNSVLGEEAGHDEFRYAAEPPKEVEA